MVLIIYENYDCLKFVNDCNTIFQLTFFSNYWKKHQSNDEGINKKQIYNDVMGY